ncbi:ribosomal protein S5, C-terminal domain-containing protein [Blastocladiella britannica]|nr:ribosomal protein S5, C-terminal domain-containing protein [Blastocladiella britannica]
MFRPLLVRCAAAPLNASSLPLLYAARGLRSLSSKQQTTPVTIWDQSLRTDPSAINPARYMPAKTLEQITVPFTASANGPLPATPYASTDTDAAFGPRLRKTLVSMRRTVKVTKGGKVVSMSAMVVVGDGKGAVGYGEGKDAAAPAAVKKATALAMKNMVVVDRYDDRTILHNLDTHFKATHIVMRAAPPGFGIRTNPNVHEICRCAGIDDVSAKVMGSRNPINVVKATFKALQAQKTPEDLARSRGLRVHDVRKLVYGQ